MAVGCSQSAVRKEAVAYATASFLDAFMHESQFAKPCHMDPLGVWAFFTAGRLIRTAPTHKVAGHEIFIAWLRFRRGRPKGDPLDS